MNNNISSSKHSGEGNDDSPMHVQGWERQKNESSSYPRILHPGCGSSDLGVVLQREHGCTVVNADFVDEEVLEKFRDRYPGCEFRFSDARRTDFDDGSFDLIIDKGLFDSVTAGTEGRAQTARTLLGEAARVLSTGGRYMLFSVFGDEGCKDMHKMLAQPGFEDDIQMKVLDTPPFEYPDQDCSYLYILTKASTRSTPPPPPSPPPSSKPSPSLPI
ncbi:unnamed protein product [Sphacelaria rigidula]